jgi:hypothetical protein
MTWTEFSQVITAMGVLTSAVLSWRNGRKLVEVRDLTKKVQEEANGMKSELVEEVRKASFAKGVKSETDKEAKGP